MANSIPIASLKRRTQEPPRNEHGQIYCDHINCQGNEQTFKRPCEWKRHMDRHDRPYKCLNVACTLNPGFTYPGGLVRHEKEVHKMHASTRRSLRLCPFPRCSRSSGSGFTRKENLDDHIRRRHLKIDAANENGNHVKSESKALQAVIRRKNEQIQTLSIEVELPSYPSNGHEIYVAQTIDGRK